MLEKIAFRLGLVKGTEIDRQFLHMIHSGMGKLYRVTYRLPSGAITTKIETI